MTDFINVNNLFSIVFNPHSRILHVSYPIGNAAPIVFRNNKDISTENTTKKNYYATIEESAGHAWKTEIEEMYW